MTENNEKIEQAVIVVVLATHNGSDVLVDVLEGYANIETPSVNWAIVIVDNASTDKTHEILKSFLDRIPLVIFEEPIPSKNRALNLALDNIGLSSDLYIFTDDDAIPEPDFLRRWEDVLKNRTDNELFGAIVCPYFREPPPDWLNRYAEHFGELYAQIDRPSGEMLPQDIYGPNMAVRRSVLARGNRFNEAIGPNSAQSDYPMGSENEFCIRVSKGGFAPPWFADGPKVRHIVRPNQTTYDYIGRRAYKHGRGVAMRQCLEADFVRLPHPTAKGAIMQVFRWCAARLSIGDFWWRYNWHKGYRGWLTEYNRIQSK